MRAVPGRRQVQVLIFFAAKLFFAAETLAPPADLGNIARLERHSVAPGFRLQGLGQMRGYGLRVLLFALAMALQAFLPTAASVASYPASSPGKAAFQVCSPASADFQNDTAPLPSPSERHRGDCAFCQLSCDGAATFADAASGAGAPLPQQREIVWTTANGDAPAPRREAARQPRAPPKFS